MDAPTFHMAMYPWFAFGHLTPFLHLSNKLAKKGNRISFLIPAKTKSVFEPFNLHPDLISFIPVTVPSVDGLPPGTETTRDVPPELGTLLMTSMDQTQNDIENLLRDLKVDIVFFDFAYWMPHLARRLAIKCVMYCITSPAAIGYSMSPARKVHGGEVTLTDLMQPPEGYPDPSIRLHRHEARAFAARRVMKYGGDILFYDRLFNGLSQSDAISFRTCREIEGPYCDYLESQFGKSVLLSGPVIPEQPTKALEETWAEWLGGFKDGSVIYCAFGSEWTLKKDQFQELVLGLELTGRPFLAALKAPIGAESIEAALPEKFEERTKGRGIVYGGWVQQQLILGHPSVGCFITHGGPSSLFEALVNKCQLVFLPNTGDQTIIARVMSRHLKVGVELETGEDDGLFTREGVREVVRIVMDEDSQIGKQVRENHDRIREGLLNKDLESSYIDNFNKKLHDLLRS